jgi:hypothetical protein
MRQGPDYGMPVELNHHQHYCLPVPLELSHEFENASHVTWRLNTDGTYQITIHELRKPLTND